MKTPTMGGAGKGQAANSPDTDHKQEVTRTKGCSSPLVEPQSSSDPSQTPGSATTESHHPVDRGWAWVILLAVFVLQLVTVGVMRAFGVLFVAIQMTYGTTASTIGIMGLVQATAFSITSPLSVSVFMEIGSARQVILLGVLVGSAGCAVSFLANGVAYLIVSFAACMGISFGLVISPAFVLLQLYFKTKSPMASAIAYTGGSIGGVIMPVATRLLLDEYSLSGTFLLLAGVMAQVFVFASLLTPVSHYGPRGAKSSSRSLQQRPDVVQHLVKSTEHTTLDVLEGQHLLAKASSQAAELSRPDCVSTPHLLVRPQSPSGKQTRPDVVETHHLQAQSPSQSMQKTLLSVVETQQLLAKSSPKAIHHPRLDACQQLLAQYPSVCTKPTRPEVTQTQRCLTSQRRQSLQRQRPVSAGAIEEVNVTNIFDVFLMTQSLQTLDLRHRDTRRHGGPGPEGLVKNLNQFLVVSSAGCTSLLSLATQTHDVHHNSRTHAPFTQDLSKGKTKVRDTNDGDHLSPRPTWRGLVCEKLAVVFHPALLRRPIFWVLAVYHYLACIACALPATYLPALAQEKGLTVTEGALLLTISGALDIVSRLLPGFIAQAGLVKPHTLVATSLLVLGVLFQFTTMANSMGLLTLMSVVYGLFAGVFFSMLPLILVEFGEPGTFRHMFGMIQLALGVSGMTGYPIIGYLSDMSGSYVTSFHFMGGCGLLSCLLLFLMPALRRWEERWRETSDLIHLDP